MKNERLYRYLLGIEGMRCGMCEEHIQSALRNAFPLKKVKANRHKKSALVVSKIQIEESAFHKVIDPLGYPLVSYEEIL